MIDILDKKDCCGCGACVQKCPKQCILLKEDEEGFLYPETDSNACVDCGLCEGVCPVLEQGKACKPKAIYAAVNRNEEIRNESSSGGLFSLLAEQVIAKGGVVFGARFNENWDVVHDWTETVEGLAAFRSSKYVQSVMGICYRQAEAFLKCGREVLFTGTSCQIAGLCRYLRKDYSNLLTMDVVCHGVPSPLVWRDYLCNLKTRPEGVAGKNTVSSSLNNIPVITGISFRDKLTGWKKYGFSVSKHSQKLFYEMHRENLFMQGFLKDLYLRPCCYDCPAKGGKAGSDLTLADYWGIQQIYPDMDDDKGTSLVLIHSPKGEKMFDTLKCDTRATSYEDALRCNPCIEHPVRMPEQREIFWRQYHIEGPAAISQICRSMRPAFTVRCISLTKRLIKKICRI